MPPDSPITTLASLYTAAWCSQDPSRVAAFFTPDGSLTINEGQPAIGREAITAAAQSFMTAFPDLEVFLDRLDIQPTHTVYHWTLTGSHTSGRRVRISGSETWTLTPEPLIAHSIGHFDAAEYRRQLDD